MNIILFNTSNRFFLKNLPFKFLLLSVLLTFNFLAQPSQAETAETMSSTLSPTESFVQGSSKFSIGLYGKFVKGKSSVNIIFSPFSIQACVGMVRIGAEGETARELDAGLGLGSSDVTTIAATFHSVLALYENSDILKIANRIYVMEGLNVQKEFNDIISTKFLSTVQAVDFAQQDAAASSINKWVELKTNHLIKNLISPSDVSSDTRVVLVNAIYFKGEWVHQFPKRATRNDDFYLNEVDTVQVPMMSLKERFRFADLPELDAKAVEMPYKDSDLSMLIILPNSRTGLSGLEEKLQDVSLADISKKMNVRRVHVRMPKFKAEFEAQLNDPLIEMGMSRMFSGVAEFGKMLDSGEALRVSKVIHKAFIEVNEEGTEAAAATAAIVRKKRSIGFDPNETIFFTAEHPFFYVINHEIKTNPSTIALFTGAVKQLHNTENSAQHDEL